jgi:DNA primase
LIKQSPAKWQQALSRSVYVMDWLVEHLATLHDLSTAPGKRAYSDALVEILRRVRDPVESDHYVGVVATKLGVSPDSLARKLKTVKDQPPAKRQRSPAAGAQSPTIRFSYIDTFLGLLLLYPDTRDAVGKLEGTTLPGVEQQTVLEALRQNPKLDAESLPQIENYVKIIMFRAEEFYGGSTSSARLADAMQTARRIARETKKRQTAELATRLRDAADSADAALFESLLEQTHRRLKDD